MTHSLPTVHILYENAAWLPPLTEALKAEGFPIRLWPVDGGLIDPSEEPPEGLWINRISPSSHTRAPPQRRLDARVALLASSPPAPGDQRPRGVRTRDEQASAGYGAASPRHLDP